MGDHVLFIYLLMTRGPVFILRTN
ncbi:hypothetical protein MTBLM5_240013 [Magnetospirillum sp. LM-5]|nr:hypothetical protein MTBLM5_240013 [Magnetospirillum sp. LM-5]